MKVLLLLYDYVWTSTGVRDTQVLLPKCAGIFDSPQCATTRQRDARELFCSAECFETYLTSFVSKGICVGNSEG